MPINNLLQYFKIEINSKILNPDNFNPETFVS